MDATRIDVELLNMGVEKRRAGPESTVGGASPPAVVDSTPDGIAFPEPPSSSAYHGLAGEIAKMIEPYSEADPIAILAQSLVMAGNAMGRGPHQELDGSRHGGNLYLVLVGDSATSRKGTSLSHTRSLFSKACPAWDERITTGLSSGEGIIEAIRDQRFAGRGEVDPGVEDKRLLVAGGEFATVLINSSRQGNNLTGVLREAWDGVPIGSLTKNPTRCKEPHVSVIGHITPDELRKEFNAVHMANGFGNRIVFLAVRRSKFLSRSGKVPEIESAKMISRIEEAIGFASTCGVVKMSDSAWNLWDDAYPALTTPPRGLVGAMCGRAAPIVRRHAMIHALLNLREVIEADDLEASLALWDYCQRSLSWIFGDSTGNRLAEEIRGLLRSRGTAGATRTMINDFCQRNIPKIDISNALLSLKAQGLARVEKKGTGGRSAEVWFTTELPS